MASLEINKLLEFKSLNIIVLPFLCSNEETIRKSIMFRYNKNKMTLQIISKKINELFSILKDKNPDLLSVMQKTISFAPSYT